MNKKGFTLVELLAVIVILAIIALIATPIVINVVNESRENANKRSVEGYMKAYETAYYQAQLKGQNVEFNNVTSVQSVEYSGTEVTCEKSTIKLENGKISATCKIGDKTYNYTSDKGVK